jgi:NADH:ubiquinone oxidoreductase subunit 5 (subunit L)/multisubunit Na+/H+ antiporter MnhA subunit
VTDSTTGQVLLWCLVVVPAAAGVALLLGGRRLDAVAPAVAVGVAGATTAVATAVAVGRPRVGVPFLAGADLGLRVDGLGAVLAPTIGVVTTIVLLGAYADVREARARFHGTMLVFAGAALLTVTATSLPTLLLAWEVMGATSYSLIGFRWRDPHAVGSGLVAFLTTRAADLGLYLAAGAAVAGGATLTLDDLPHAVPGWRDVAAAGVLCAALGKAAQLVFAFWLSRAMDGPSPVSALLHSAAMVALGGFLLLRLQPLLASTSWAGPTTAWAGAVTTVLLGLVALGQRDVKQLLAASTSAQLGFVILAAGVGARTAGLVHLVAHAATKAGLFLAAGAWLSALGTRRLAGLRGQVARWPVVRVGATVALLALAGAPPLSLWASKDLVLAAALHQSPALYAVGLVGAALSAAYAGAVLRVLWAPVRPAEADRAAQHRGEVEPARDHVPGTLAVAVALLATGAAVLGALGLPAVVRTLGRAVGERVTEPGVAELALSAVVAPAVLVATWWRPVPVPAWTRSWLSLEPAVHRFAVLPVLRAAAAVDRADGALEGVTRAAARATVAAAQVVGTADERWVHGAVRGVARRVRALALQARRPQTGALQQYYVQAVALVAGGTVLVLVLR